MFNKKCGLLLALLLLLVSVSGVCATEPDADDTITKLIEENAQLNETLINQSIEIKQEEK